MRYRVIQISFIFSVYFLNLLALLTCSLSVFGATSVVHSTTEALKQEEGSCCGGCCCGRGAGEEADADASAAAQAVDAAAPAQ